MRKLRIAVVLLLVTLAGGCAVTPPAPVSPVDWNTVKLQRQGLTHWNMSGRAAVAVGDQGWTANMDWRQENQLTLLKLSGNFGIGGVHVRSDGESLEIETSKGEKFSGEAAAAMLQRALQVDLPLQFLRFWLLGVPEPKAPTLEQLGPQGNVYQLDQAGWKVTYDQYRSPGVERNSPPQAAVPGLIVLEKSGVRVKVIVDRWQL